MSRCIMRARYNNMYEIAEYLYVCVACAWMRCLQNGQHNGRNRFKSIGALYMYTCNIISYFFFNNKILLKLYDVSLEYYFSSTAPRE